MRVLLGLLALVLSACGGGGGTSQPQASAPAISAPVISVSFYGDSTVEAPYSVNNFVSEAQTILGSRYALKNEGVSGTYSQQLLDGTDGKHPAWVTEMAKSTASAVVINHAINDHFYPLSQYRANLVALVSIAQSAGKKVVLQTPNPIDSTVLDLAEFGQRVVTMRQVAAQTGAILCEQYDNINHAGLALETLDGVHPNPKLFAFMGSISASCLREI